MAKDVRRKNFRQTKQGKLKEIKSAKNRIKHSRGATSVQAEAITAEEQEILKTLKKRPRNSRV
jgi:hypothetical protein